MYVIHFGAGNIGKGLIGYILSLNQCRICFVDINRETVKQLNNEQQYLINVLEQNPNILTIHNVSACWAGEQSDVLIEQYQQADLITTSVGVNNLAKIAPALLQLIEARAKINKPIDIIANENAINASSLLENEVKKLAGDEHYAALKPYCSFVNSAIDRQSLTTEHNGQSITAVEPFYEWVVNSSQVINKQLLTLQGIKFVPDLQPYIEKKLYIVNLGHCATAYLGFLAGHTTVQQTLPIKAFRHFIRATMQQSGNYLIRQYGFSADEITDYIENTLARFTNPHLQDAVTRVGASPIRKLGSNERIIGPLQALYHHQLPYDYLIKVVALALCFDVKSDEQSQQIQTMIVTKGIADTVSELTSIVTPTLIEDITEHYLNLKQLIVTDTSAENKLIKFLSA